MKKWVIIPSNKICVEDIREYCSSCRRETRELGKPSLKAMDCWKIIVSLDTEKFSKALDIIRDIIEDAWCWIEYSVNEEEGIAITTCRKWSTMWSVREQLINKFLEERLIAKPYLPYRRGGNYYDRDYGPWRLWAIRYYPEKLPVTNIASIKTLCPHDGALMEYTGKGLKCMLCGLYIPETTIYETIENGVSEYRPRTGLYKEKIYILRYIGADKILIERKHSTTINQIINPHYPP